ncbi:MAG: family 10 glycosylhydrolase [Bacteroidetes bacterium]|nr:family 10 glycosylhydrolase [Bacteroidota bacterium]
MQKKLQLLFLILFSFHIIYAQAPKRELRGAWIATVYNIDWPSSTSSNAKQSELREILDSLQSAGINAVFFQVRPSCDAFYQSSIEPWSEWLMGTQGTPPPNSFDPLAFAINECRKRGMELHAWLNPFRAVVSISGSNISNSHISVTQPTWCVTYGNVKYLNPGLPQARKYVCSVIKDIITRYAVDGIHFDDYFYPYPNGNPFNDNAAFAADPRGFTNQNNWRRDNVNLFIQMVQDTINHYKPRVKFGVSPFGIWRNQSNDALGSATSGLESYDDLYCDSRLWHKMGYVDYTMPQLYWKIGNSVANYSVLAQWWSAVPSTNSLLFIGHASENLNPLGSNWNISEITKQIRLNRGSYANDIKGSCFYSANSILYNHKKIKDSLSVRYYQYYSLQPTMTWKDNVKPNSPSGLSITTAVNGLDLDLIWTPPTTATDGEGAYRYVIYRDTGATVSTSLAEKIRFITYDNLPYYTDKNAVPAPFKKVSYKVTAIDTLHNESAFATGFTYCAPNVNGVSINGPTNVNSGTTVTLSASGSCSSCSYLWSTGATTTSISAVITNSTSTTFSLTISNPCGSKTTSKLIYTNPSSVTETEADKYLSIYPNPFSNNTVLELRLDKASKVTAELYNTLGELTSTIITNEFYTSGIHQLEFTKYIPEGFYTIRIQLDDKIISKSILRIEK